MQTVSSPQRLTAEVIPFGADECAVQLPVRIRSIPMRMRSISTFLKPRLKSSSGMTLIEVILALGVLLTISVGFAKLFAFAAITLNYAGYDTSANATGRSAVNTLLASPVDPLSGDSVDISIVWAKGSADVEQDFPVIRETVDVACTNGSDDEMNLYRKHKSAAEPEEPPVSDIVTTFIVYVSYGGGPIGNWEYENRDGGVPYDEIIVPTHTEVLIKRAGRMPDYWKILELKNINSLVLGPFLTYHYGRIWDTENENISEASFLFPFWYGVNETHDCTYCFPDP